MFKSQQSNKHITIIGLTPFERIFLLIAPPAAGLIVGYFLPSIADWAAGLPWFPFQGPLKLVASIQEIWLTAVTTILGFIAGMWLSAEAIKDSLIITVSDEEVILNIADSTHRYSRSDIASMFIDGKELVLLGNAGQELARERYESTPAKIADAFVKHRYSWSFDGDPYEAEYRLWVDHTPDLSPALNALLRARNQALQKKDMESAKEMQCEASKLGIIVKDKGKFQYWRNPGKTHEVRYDEK
ncbi:hypothetical protein [Paenibacillus sp. 32352]|uniref:YqeB family protein n=1 Tax=Paenibacillus sp. 32352 TaxID=1969111 RepID=UPI0009AC42A1|nr:hypothetical protein [Paenibacillus sp. 32352]